MALWKSGRVVDMYLLSCMHVHVTPVIRRACCMHSKVVTRWRLQGACRSWLSHLCGRRQFMDFKLRQIKMEW
jgi:hypothetical protein